MDVDSRIEAIKARGVRVSESKAQEGQPLGTGVEGVYNPAPGNEGMAGQYRTPSSPQPQQGKAADQITMAEDKDVEIRIGNVVLKPNGFFQSAFEVTEDGRRVSPTRCLRAVYDALKASGKFTSPPQSRKR